MSDMFNKTARELAAAEQALSDARIALKQAQRNLEAAERRHRDADKFHLVEQVRCEMEAKA